MKRAAIPLLALALTACADGGGSAIHSAATAGTAAAIGAAGGPVGVVLGIAAGYAIDQGVKYGERQIEQNVQTAVAEAAGPLDVGRSAEWQVAEPLPLSSRAGTVEVARLFGEAIPCKDVVFTVSEHPELFTGTVCEAKTGAWRWATAEPNIHRWGSLQ